MIKLYGIKTCGSVRKAITQLEAQKVAFEFCDLKTHSEAKPLFSKDDVKSWIEAKGIKVVLNTKGTTFRAMKKEGQIPAYLLESIEQGTSDKNTLDSQIDLLFTTPLLLKRPVIIAPQAKSKEARLIIGYDEALITTL